MPKLFNKHHKNVPADAVYIGRGSPWGNPWSHLPYADAIPVNTRAEAVAQYETHIMNLPGFHQKIKDELRGKDLVCFCAPKTCHGEILLRIANEEEVSDES